MVEKGFQAKREVEDRHEEEQKVKPGRLSKAPKIDDKATINQLVIEKQNLDDYCEETFRVACNIITLADTIVADLKETGTQECTDIPSPEPLVSPLALFQRSRNNRMRVEIHELHL